MSARFERYIGIDYSGAQTPRSSLKGLRVYEADRSSDPHEVEPPPSPRKYWTRRGVADARARGCPAADVARSETAVGRTELTTSSGSRRAAVEISNWPISPVLHLAEPLQKLP